MRQLRNYLSYLPKGLKGFILAVMGLSLLIAPFQSATAAESAEIEGAFGVANQTDGDTDYHASIDANYNDFVAFQVVYHNRELPDSGRVAENLGVDIDFPNNQPGATQTATVSIKGDNTNTVTDSVTVNLDREDAVLDFVEGSAKWHYNKQAKDGVERCQTGLEEAPEDCYAVEELNDSVVTGEGMTVLEDAQPCYAYVASVTFLARVKVPSINVQKMVRVKGESDWKTENTAKPGDTLQYQMKVENIGNQTLNNVTLGDNPPAEITYVPGSTKLLNSNHPNGTTVDSDNITTGGIGIGNIAQNGVTYVMFDAVIDEEAEFNECGNYRLKNVAVVDSDETGPYENYAYTNVDIECAQQQPEFSCDSLNASKLSRVKYEFTANASAVEADIERYVFHFGDGSSEPVVTDQEQATVQHTYAEAGDYSAYVLVETSEGDTERINDCEVNVTVSPEDEKPPEEEKPPVEELPRTGPLATAFAVFGGSSTVAYLTGAYRRSREALHKALLGDK